ncbi:hypothetical protein MWU49_13630 [Alcanivorax sp. S6407]|uniref:hypothetical protein n=1 Tax=Alcanivorax sp. S6407 TaxID=2926424 RepID=UPI001FF353DE|nr:hypothetical protein [Alcanivorax sp. S6407]MCK0154755.1 hypothetical protein [Alcanivorax sp. S6407]
MRFITLSAISISVLALSACGGDNDRRPVQIQPAIDYTAFVKVQLANTRDDREPVNINRLRLIDRDSNNPEAYDSVLDTPNQAN